MTKACIKKRHSSKVRLMEGKNMQCNRHFEAIRAAGIVVMFERTLSAQYQSSQFFSIEQTRRSWATKRSVDAKYIKVILKPLRKTPVL